MVKSHLLKMKRAIIMKNAVKIQPINFPFDWQYYLIVYLCKPIEK
jgi:hypothetical protein